MIAFDQTNWQADLVSGKSLRPGISFFLITFSTYFIFSKNTIREECSRDSPFYVFLINYCFRTFEYNSKKKIIKIRKFAPYFKRHSFFKHLAFTHSWLVVFWLEMQIIISYNITNWSYVVNSLLLAVIFILKQYLIPYSYHGLKERHYFYFTND